MEGNKKTIFITGATGLVGSLLALTALRAGHSVRLLVRSQPNRSARDRIQEVLGLFGFSNEEWRRKAWMEIAAMSLPQFGFDRMAPLADHLLDLSAAAHRPLKQSETGWSISKAPSVLKLLSVLAPSSYQHRLYCPGIKHIVFEQALGRCMRNYEETNSCRTRSSHLSRI
jgi:hypothetical protein